MSTAKILAVSAIALAAGAAAAGEFWQNGPSNTLSPGNSLEQSRSTSVNHPNPSGTYNGSAGQFSGFYGGSPDGFLRWFCVEFAQAAPASSTYTLSTSPIGSWAADTYSNLQKLYDLYYPDNGFTDFFQGGVQTTFGKWTTGSTTDQNTNAAAFQLAVWEIVFDSDLDLSAGTLNTSDSLAYKAQAQMWLDAVDSYGGTAYKAWTVYTLTNGSYQDFVTARIVPEPGSLALAGLALAGLGFASRRRRG